MAPTILKKRYHAAVLDSDSESESCLSPQKLESTNMKWTLTRPLLAFDKQIASTPTQRNIPPTSTPCVKNAPAFKLPLTLSPVLKKKTDIYFKVPETRKVANSKEETFDNLLHTPQMNDSPSRLAVNRRNKPLSRKDNDADVERTRHYGGKIGSNNNLTQDEGDCEQSIVSTTKSNDENYRSSHQISSNPEKSAKLTRRLRESNVKEPVQAEDSAVLKGDTQHRNFLSATHEIGSSKIAALNAPEVKNLHESLSTCKETTNNEVLNEVTDKTERILEEPVELNEHVRTCHEGVSMMSSDSTEKFGKTKKKLRKSLRISGSQKSMGGELVPQESLRRLSNKSTVVLRKVVSEPEENSSKHEDEASKSETKSRTQENGVEKERTLKSPQKKENSREEWKEQTREEPCIDDILSPVLSKSVKRNKVNKSAIKQKKQSNLEDDASKVPKRQIRKSLRKSNSQISEKKVDDDVERQTSLIKTGNLEKSIEFMKTIGLSPRQSIRPNGLKSTGLNEIMQNSGEMSKSGKNSSSLEAVNLAGCKSPSTNPEGEDTGGVDKTDNTLLQPRPAESPKRTKTSEYREKYNTAEEKSINRLAKDKTNDKKDENEADENEAEDDKNNAENIEVCLTGNNHQGKDQSKAGGKSTRKKLSSKRASKVIRSSNTSLPVDRPKRERKRPGEYWVGVPQLESPVKRNVSGYVKMLKSPSGDFSSDSEDEFRPTKRRKASNGRDNCKDTKKKVGNRESTSGKSDTKVSCYNTTVRKKRRLLSKQNCTVPQWSAMSAEDYVFSAYPQSSVLVCKTSNVTLRNKNSALPSENSKLKVGSTVSWKFISGSLMEIEPGGVVGPQVDILHHLIFVILENSVILKILEDHSESTLTPGDSAVVPAGWRFSMLNTGDNTARLNVININDKI